MSQHYINILAIYFTSELNCLDRKAKYTKKESIKKHFESHANFT